MVADHGRNRCSCGCRYCCRHRLIRDLLKRELVLFSIFLCRGARIAADHTVIIVFLVFFAVADGKAVIKLRNVQIPGIDRDRFQRCHVAQRDTVDAPDVLSDHGMLDRVAVRIPRRNALIAFAGVLAVNFHRGLIIVHFAAAAECQRVALHLKAHRLTAPAGGLSFPEGFKFQPEQLAVIVRRGIIIGAHNALIGRFFGIASLIADRDAVINFVVRRRQLSVNRRIVIRECEGFQRRTVGKRTAEKRPQVFRQRDLLQCAAPGEAVRSDVFQRIRELDAFQGFALFKRFPLDSFDALLQRDGFQAFAAVKCAVGDFRNAAGNRYGFQRIAVVKCKRSDFCQRRRQRDARNFIIILECRFNDIRDALGDHNIAGTRRAVKRDMTERDQLLFRALRVQPCRIFKCGTVNLQLRYAIRNIDRFQRRAAAEAVAVEQLNGFRERDGFQRGAVLKRIHINPDDPRIGDPIRNDDLLRQCRGVPRDIALAARNLVLHALIDACAVYRRRTCRRCQACAGSRQRQNNRAEE